MTFRYCLLIALTFFLTAHESTLLLGELGSVRYLHDDKRILQIDRLSPDGEIIYTHSYVYDNEGRLIAEKLIGDLGDIVYEPANAIKSPYHLETCEYDENHNVISHRQDDLLREYTYNNLNELISEDSGEYFEYDLTGHLIQKGGMHFTYDEDNHLIRASSADYEMSFTYDTEGKRISKTVNGIAETYLYLDSNEVGILDHEGNLKELRIPGMSIHKDIVRSIAIETPNAIYAPIHDLQWNIVKLIDIRTREVITLDLPDPFGRGLSKNSPTAWIFFGKHYDRESDLVYFGQRYYCPELKKWLTPDPLLQTNDPYQYCFNNPLSFWDPDGRFTLPVISLLWGAGTVITMPIWGTGALIAAAGAATGWAAYEAVKYANNWIENQRNAAVLEQLQAFPYCLEKGKEGTQRDGTPGPNDAQNKQARDAKKEIEKNIGRKLTQDEIREFHDYITGQDYSYHELVEEGCRIFGGQ
jgi:RHS repeat-associated protein